MPELHRPAWVEIDLDAVAHNVRLTRKLIGPKVKLFATVKADGMGFGLVPLARTAAEAGADALAVADPDDVIVLREAGLELPILLFVCTVPEQAADVAALENVIASVHDFPSLEAFTALDRPVDVFFKISCGGGRYGFEEEELAQAFAAARKAPNMRLKGIYTHPSSPEDPEFTRTQAESFERAFAEAATHGFTDLEKLAASSRVVIGFPEMHYTACDPGRMLVGYLPRPWDAMVATRPALRAIKSRITQVREHPAGKVIEGIQPGGDPVTLERAMRTAVVPIGFSDGFNALPPLGDVLVRGRRAPVLGRRGIESTKIDVTDVPDAQVGSEVVLLGRQGDEEITALELSECLGLALAEIIYRLACNPRRVYVGADEAAAVAEISVDRRDFAPA